MTRNLCLTLIGSAAALLALPALAQAPAPATETPAADTGEDQAPTTASTVAESAQPGRTQLTEAQKTARDAVGGQLLTIFGGVA